LGLARTFHTSAYVAKIGMPLQGISISAMMQLWRIVFIYTFFIGWISAAYTLSDDDETP
jgi:hypothetical protein